MSILTILNRSAKLILTQGLYEKLLILYQHLFARYDGQPKRKVEMVNWNVYLEDSRMDPRLREMLKVFMENHEMVMTSTYWSVLCRKNVAQLLDMGYENFKQTVAMNYFTWLVDQDDPQAVFLQSHLPEKAVTLARERANGSKLHAFMTKEQSLFFNLMTYLLWDYAERTVGTNLMAHLEESAEGNPPSVSLNGKNISQDLANSVLEFYSISSGLPRFDSHGTILEIGGGYGRTAYVFLQLLPHARYIMVDIPPALYIAERYISGSFPNRKTFRYRNFRSFSEVEAEFREAQIAFLMPDQLAMLPDHMADLFLAIDCLHEMRPEQIRKYFLMIDRLAANFYLKCWKKT